jgi:hypothetical protein
MSSRNELEPKSAKTVLIAPLGTRDPRLEKLIRKYSPDELVVIRNRNEPEEHRRTEERLDKVQKYYGTLLKEGAENKTVTVDYFDTNDILRQLGPLLEAYRGHRVVIALNQGPRIVCLLLVMIAIKLGGMEVIWLPRTDYTLPREEEEAIDDEWFKKYAVHFDPKTLEEKLLLPEAYARFLRYGALFAASASGSSAYLTAIGILPFHIGLPLALASLVFLLAFLSRIRGSRL